MPMIAAAAVAVFATATAVTTAFATIGAITVFGVSLATIATVGLAVSTLVAAVTMSSAFKKPKSQETGSQLQLQLDPHASVPVVYGRTATAGNPVYKRTGGGSKNPFLYLACVLSVGPIQSIQSATFDDLVVNYSSSPLSGLATVTSTTPYASGSKTFLNNRVRSHWNLGPTVNTPLTARIGETPPLMTSAWAFHGLAHTFNRFEYDTEALPSGEPRKQIYVVQGRQLYDPRKDSTYPGGSGSHRRADPATWEFSENPYLAALDWTLGSFVNGRRVYGIGAPVEMVDVPAFVAAANIADANAWKVGGVVTSGDDKFACLTAILQAGGGLPVASAGRISVLVNTLKTSVLTITDEDIIGDVETTGMTGWRDTINTIVPQYREESQAWETIAGDEISVPAYVTEDDGEIRSTEIVFGMVQGAAQAHQLAAYELVNAREALTVKLNGKPRLLNVRVGEAVTLTHGTLITARKMVVVSRDFDPRTLGVSLTLRSETDAKHAFALGQSQVAPPTPAVNGFDPSAPEAPGASAWTISDTVIANASGVSIPALVITGANDDPNTAAIKVEYRRTGATDWIEYTVGTSASIRFEVSGLTDGDQYDAAISYRTVRGFTTPRRVLGPVTVGVSTAGGVRPGGIPWNPTANTSPITGVPPVLTTIDPNGRFPSNSVTVGNTTLTVAFANVSTLSVNTAAQLANAISATNAVFLNAANAIGSANAQANAAANAATANAAIAFTQANAATLQATNALANATLAATRAGYAASNATAAQTSAGYAGSNATIAQAQAGFASSNATLAQSNATLSATYAGQAGSNATIASTQAGYATANASIAQTQATLATGFAGQAQANASLSATQLGYATANAAGAQSQAVLAASFAGQSSANAGISATQAGFATANAATANTQRGLAVTYAGQAQANATAAQGSAGVAATQAGYAGSNASTAQAQAGLATTYAGYASGNATAAQTSAGVSSTQAGYSTANAAIASTQAGLSTTYAGQSLANATASNTSRTYAASNASLADAQRALAVTYAGQALSNATAAQGSAGVAATQAAYAGSNASTAQAQATLAANYSGQAGANAVSAQAQATIATQQAGYASANATAAATSSTLAARVGVGGQGYVNASPSFAQAARPGSGTPDGWRDWVTGSAYSVITGQVSDKGLRWVVPSNTNTGIAADSTSNDLAGNPTIKGAVGAGWWVVDALVTLESGSLLSSGVLLQTTGGGAPMGEDKTFPFSSSVPNGLTSAPGAGSAGKTYSYSFLFQLTASATDRFILYAMPAWSGIDAAAMPAKTIVFHACGIRRASAAEIETGQARLGWPSLSAAMTTINQARVDGDTALASRATILEALNKTIPNKLPNSDGSQGARGWSGSGVTYVDPNVGSYFNVSGSGDRYHVSDLIPVSPNGAYCHSFDGDGGSVPANCGVYFSEFDASGNYIASRDGQGFANFEGTGWFVRKAGTPFTTGSSTYFVKCVIWKGPTTAYVNVSRIMFTPGIEQIGWSDEATVRDVTARVTMTESVASGADGKVNAKVGLTLDVNGKISGWSAANNGTSSTFDIKADTFRVSGGGSTITPMVFRNGQLRVSSVMVDELNAGASMTVGTAKLKVQVQPFDLSVTDGQVVSFGYDLGQNPILSFAQNNLAALGSGETYKCYADSLTATGFTARLKIETPAAPSNLNTGLLNANANGPTTHHAYIDGYGGRTTTGSYDVRVTGTIRSLLVNPYFGSGGAYEADSYYQDGYVDITVYGWNGGAWVTLGSIQPGFPFRGPLWAPGYYDDPYDVTVSIPTGTNISHIGVAKTYESYSSSVSQFGVAWQTQGSGAGIRSATPSGQVSTVTVRPRT